MNNSLAQRSISAAMWGSAGAIAKLTIQLITQIALARILGPEIYGQFAICLIAIGFANFIADFGFSYSIIQKQDLSDREITFILGLQIITGAIATTAIAMSADIIAKFFNKVDSSESIKLLSIVCIITAVGSISTNILKRKLNQKALQLSQILSYTLGYAAIGIPMAIHGFGLMSLTTAWITQATTQTGISYLFARHPVIPSFKSESYKSTITYGINVLTANLTNWSLANIDKILIGQRFSSTNLGLYATIYNILYNGASSVLGVLQATFFSASSKMQSDLGAKSRAYLAINCISSLFTIPFFISISIISETFVHTLYGDKWIDAAGLFRPLAAAMPAFILWGLATPVLWTAGHGSRETIINGKLIVISIILMLIAATQNTTAVAWTVFLIYFIRAGYFISISIRILEIQPIIYLKSQVPGSLIALFIAVPLYFTDRTLTDQLANPIVIILIETLLATTAWSIAFRATQRTLDGPSIALLSSISTRIPKIIVNAIFGKTLANSK